MFNVLDVQRGGVVLVDGRLLFRVVYGPTREVVGELLDRDRANRIASLYRDCTPNEFVDVIGYPEIAQSASSC